MRLAAATTNQAILEHIAKEAKTTVGEVKKWHPYPFHETRGLMAVRGVEIKASDGDITIENRKDAIRTAIFKVRTFARGSPYRTKLNFLDKLAENHYQICDCYNNKE